jgi:hypothetical protein
VRIRDFAAALLTVLFFALTWGLIEYSDRLMGGKG